MKFKGLAIFLVKTILPITVGMVLLVLIVAWMTGMFNEKIEPGNEPSSARRFDPATQNTYEVREVQKQYLTEAVGTLKSAQRTEISSRVLAPIDRILVTAGQTVVEGQPLV
ncbi:MAG: efflux RND transporter periplasmic adaptor subunit, partial [Pirellulales bacterium]|nr:efflux RND transporter periplasmic adaptor subunit [Pirellulales bacterium]